MLVTNDPLVYQGVSSSTVVRSAKKRFLLRKRGKSLRLTMTVFTLQCTLSSITTTSNQLHVIIIPLYISLFLPQVF